MLSSCKRKLPHREAVKRTRQSRRNSLLDLLQELKDQIYEECLVSSQAIDIHCLSSIPGPTTLGLSTALLQACRQIYTEALDVLYGLNTFKATIVVDPHGICAHAPVQRTSTTHWRTQSSQVRIMQRPSDSL